MKKIHLIAATAVFALTACSNDETVRIPEAAAIGFESYIGKTTRADDATTSNVKSITVYGYIGDTTPAKIFDGTTVSNTSGDWTYQPLQFWTADKNYFFTSVASQVSSGNSNYSYTWAETLPTATAGFHGFGTIGFDNSKANGNEDVIYAYQTATTPATLTAAPDRVKFAFNHALSRVKFSFLNSMASDAYSIRIHDLKITNAAASGTLELGTANPVWAASGSAELNLRPNYFVPTNATATNGDAVASGTKFIIPENKALKITFQVDLIVDGVTIATYSHSERAMPVVDFKNGWSYNFVAEINAENIDPEQELYPILFTVESIEGWQDNGETRTELEPAAA